MLPNRGGFSSADRRPKRLSSCESSRRYFNRIRPDSSNRCRPACRGGRTVRSSRGRLVAVPGRRVEMQPGANAVDRRAANAFDLGEIVGTAEDRARPSWSWSRLRRATIARARVRPIPGSRARLAIGASLGLIRPLGQGAGGWAVLCRTAVAKTSDKIRQMHEPTMKPRDWAASSPGSVPSLAFPYDPPVTDGVCYRLSTDKCSFLRISRDSFGSSSWVSRPLWAISPPSPSARLP